MRPHTIPLDLPESRDSSIQTVKSFIRELSHVQDTYQKALEESLALTEEGRILLHDFIHNAEEDEEYLSFEEFASFLGKTPQDLFTQEEKEDDFS